MIEIIPTPRTPLVGRMVTVLDMMALLRVHAAARGTRFVAHASPGRGPRRGGDTATVQVGRGNRPLMEG
ncbi:hypothetical protein GCM10007368_28940 [Isoptericola cucumis]|uniref:Uncharacterized protein n=1 Tax=Isoptericola cucumis TaxID=1776856 RepID=A0ABQ2BAH2_9MICO|nr:hypothetical protein GCM10007368_28940 [Isoptericola cucumis]